MINAKITGVGGYVPERYMTMRIWKALLINNKRTRKTYFNPYPTIAKRAIENAGLTPEDIDL